MTTFCNFDSLSDDFQYFLAQGDNWSGRNKVKNMMRQTKRNLEKDIANRSKHCPKVFWSYVRNKLKTKSGVSPLLKDTSDKTSTAFSDKEKADILQNQFTSVFTKEPDGDLPDFESRATNYISDIAITTKMVEKKILSLDVNKACGPDEIHPRLIKELVNEVTSPLAALFNKSLCEGNWRLVTGEMPMFHQFTKKVPVTKLRTIDQLA